MTDNKRLEQIRLAAIQQKVLDKQQATQPTPEKKDTDAYSHKR